MVYNLYGRTSEILNVPEEFVRSYCCGGDEDALEIVTPEQLAQEISENYGDSLMEAVESYYGLTPEPQR
jgi:hypothetical protein